MNTQNVPMHAALQVTKIDVTKWLNDTAKALVLNSLQQQWNENVRFYGVSLKIAKSDIKDEHLRHFADIMNQVADADKNAYGTLSVPMVMDLLQSDANNKPCSQREDGTWWTVTLAGNPSVEATLPVTGRCMFVWYVFTKSPKEELIQLLGDTLVPKGDFATPYIN